MTPQDDFDRWLGAQLEKGFARSRDQSRAGIAGYRSVIGRRQGSHRISPTRRSFVGKAAIALAAATLSLGAVGAAAATAVTHSVNPQAWGQQVENAVADCKAALKPGEHGIGGCVSAFAKQHGAAKQAGHGHGHGKDKSHPDASPGPDIGGQPASPQSQSGKPKNDKSHDHKPNGKPESPTGPSTP
jgi:hypothetical protein